jgi:PucR family transcriptional regulator, purine catabolism regulatory protein
MITLREALEMPVFATAQVVAGHAGLDNEISWVHIVEIPDAHYRWKRQGVLLLTAGYGLRNAPQRQTGLVPRLVEQGFAGMVFSTGYYFDHVPEVIRLEAQRSGFPLIETGREVLFIEITEAILEQIVNRQYHLLQQSTQIHEQLTGLVLEGGDLQSLATALARLLERSVTIESASLRVLAAAQYGSVDEARTRSVNGGRTSAELAQHLLDEGIYDRLLQRKGPLHVAPRPDLGMHMERIVAPVLVEGEIFGYIWIIAGDRPLTDLDELAIARGATGAALILFKEQAVHAAEAALRGDFLEQLLRDAGDLTALSEGARRLNYRLERPHQVLLARGISPGGSALHTFPDDVGDWLREQGLEALLVWRDENLVLVLENEQEEAGERLAQDLVHAISHPARRILVGVGGLSPPGTGLRNSFSQASQAVEIGAALGKQEGALSFSSLGLLNWLHHLPEVVLEANRFYQKICNLAEYDAGRNGQLLKSLETYLDHGSALLEASEALYVHRNTLLHRLERLETILEIDLHDPWQRQNLFAAIKAYRLHTG